jgi:hypothetical protein
VAAGVQLTIEKFNPLAVLDMSINELTANLVSGNEELFKPVPVISSEADLANADRRTRDSEIPREVGIVESNGDYLDRLWNWVRGITGSSKETYLPYPMHSTKYLNEYIYKRSFDPSGSRDPNIAGDLIVDPAWDQRRRPHWNVWPNKDAIPYGFSSTDPCVQTIVREALARFSEATSGCIMFKEISNPSQTELVISSQGQDCYATLGNRPDLNVLNLGLGCVNVGTAMHLLGHVLGMGHEDQRPNARDFVIVAPENIDVYGMSSSSSVDPTTTTKYHLVFEPMNGTNTAWESAIRSQPYEYGSLMHNSRSLYSVDAGTEFTIREKDGPKFEDLMGQRGVITERDARILNEMYACQRLPMKVVDRALSRPLLGGLSYDAINTCMLQDANNQRALLNPSVSSG